MRIALAGLGTLMAVTLLGAGAANAFTFETPPTAPSSPGQPARAAGLNGLDVSAVLPAFGEDVPGIRFDENSSASNGGFAAPPDPRGSVGPGWLYGR
jgi:hypothetical protein